MRLCNAIVTYSRGELLLLNAHTLIGANQVIALQDQVKGLQQELKALAAKQWTPESQQPQLHFIAASVVPPTPKAQ